ncbi:flagellin N-terminal helical domain-containing protein [Alkalibacillus salilacus]|uniref:Flagellin n=1 Tax=Alkalibacillus salilacus TaxID=284582 RepID=A0ABT9VFB7_9BACI|nr:flagellin [Alkalibacillus salilacus]MDQ0159653.1 flagellin [Alkalibacillus salilacus]
MIINTNTAAMNTHRQMGINQDQQQSAMEKLSSGLRINKAGDDAAGLAISEKMRGQINGLDQASRNAQDGISMIQTAEGALDESHSILQRMRELSVQSANDTNVDADREELQNEMDQLSEELNRISDNTEFNTQNLLDGSMEGTFQIGANEGQNLDVQIGDMSAEGLEAGTSETISGADVDLDDSLSGLEGESLNVTSFDAVDMDDTTDANGIEASYGLENSDGELVAVSENGEDYFAIEGGAKSVEDLDGQDYDENGALDFDGTYTHGTVEVGADGDEVTASRGIDINTQESANDALATLDGAIESVSSQRSELGAVQNRLEHTISNLDNSSENLSAAESRIRDADMAAQMMEQTQASVKSQAAQSMLAQANQQPQSVLQLLG